MKNRGEQVKTIFGETLVVQPAFAEVSSAVPTEFRCPACGYEWSGKKGGTGTTKDLFGNSRPTGFACPKCCHTFSKTAPATPSFGRVTRKSYMSPVVAKPPYRIPLMAEIVKIPYNRFRVVSTFSGCGGSSLGYRMAGFRVLWANEFVPAAQNTYRTNFPGTVLDVRDIRDVKPEEILAATGLKRGWLEILDGSPPCQAFSTAGKREKGWGKNKKYEHGAEQKNEDMFFEYVRLLRGIMPKTFIAENVSGLVKGTAKGYFKLILQKLESCGYVVAVKILDAQWLGVPQSRQRAIFVGVRSDLGISPAHPDPLPYRYSVREALPWIVAGGYRRGKVKPGSTWSPYNKEWDVDRDPCGTISANAEAYFGVEDAVLGRVNMKVRIARSFGAEDWVDAASTPFPCVETVPNAGVGYKGNGGKIEFLQNGKALRRRLTIAELKRICAFPDDFILTGSYAQQWARLGNAVPPIMMRSIATVVRDKILIPAKKGGA